ncbi:TRAP-type dicarboxylat transporter small permease [Nitratireductor indicus C115]|uniref:TRAP transporter small permease protein n=1 Tax=Nitratireductor indicus C115 TaxID=1231190 RepID=K2NS44_9HYPH|nr:TRAP transporter small permease subunit [Nitratireductor indicus]EKF42125.1 TRAP-type dicarboxylat transporter small permease [Nitratireductor indicus C115]SFQ61958.1 TRAP-type mannitol/chloroaromatic compound transport system, small permease component [Nitratireductor indicus]
MQAVCATITGINRLLFILAAAIIFAVVPMLLYEVVARYAFDAPTVWAMEASTLVFGPHFLLAGPYLLHLRGHVAVDIFSEKAQGPTRRALDVFACLVIAVFAGVFAVVSWPLAVNAYALGETSFSAWNPPIWWLKFIVPFSFAMLFLQALAEAAMTILAPSGEEGARS